MPISRIVVDTNILIDIMKGKHGPAEKIKSYDKAIISPIVLSELYYGAYRPANPAKQLQKVRKVIKRSKLLPINRTTVGIFVKIKVDLAAKGSLIPENDMWIASAAIQHQVPLYTFDKHFQRIDGLILN